MLVSIRFWQIKDLFSFSGILFFETMSHVAPIGLEPNNVVAGAGPEL